MSSGPFFMLNKEALPKEIENLTKLINELEVAIIMEDDPKIKSQLRSALGKLRAGRTWLIDIHENTKWRFE